MSKFQANLCLVAVTLFWSFEVIVHSVIPEEVSPFATVCCTSLLGAILLGGYFYKRIAIAIKEQRSAYIRDVGLLGVLNAVYNVFYLVGLEYFDVSVGAFTASMTVVILPVMILVMKRDSHARTWISAGLVLLGIVVAVLPSVGHEHIPGIGVMILGSLVRAVFIVKLNDFSRIHDPITLAAGIMGISSVISFIPWFFSDPATFLSLPWSRRLIAAYFVYGYFVVAFTTVLNIYAQRRASAAHATIIYSTEIIFSTIWAIVLPAILIDPVPISAPIIIGCLLVAVGNIIEAVHFNTSSEESYDVPEEDDVMIEASHPFVSVLDGATTPFRRKLLLFIALLGVYLVIAVPFKVFQVIPGFADIRPVYMLYPVYGIFFGLPGCFATGFGNLIGDILSGGLRISSIAGFLANFLYTYLLYLIWTRLPKKEFRLNTRKMVAMFIMSILLCASATVLLIAPVVAYFYPSVDIILFCMTVFANTTFFPIGFSIPFIILIQEELGYNPVPRKRHPKE